jgi:DNA-binding transcriptional ArsR family regulator
VSPSLDRASGVFTWHTTLHDIVSIAGRSLAREVLVAVAHRARSVGELASEIELDTSDVSRCLRLLLRAGLLAYRQEGRRHVYASGPRMAAARTQKGLVLTLIAETGARIVLEIPDAELAEFRWSDRPRARQGPDGPPEVAIRPAAVHAPPGGARTTPRRPSGPG